MLSLPMHQGEVTAPATGDTVKDANMTMGGAMMASLLNKALKGDVRAASLILQITGQLEERITVRNADPFEGLTTEELRKLADDGRRRHPPPRPHRPGPSGVLRLLPPLRTRLLHRGPPPPAEHLRHPPGVRGVGRPHPHPMHAPEARQEQDGGPLHPMDPGARPVQARHHVLVQ